MARPLTKTAYLHIRLKEEIKVLIDNAATKAGVTRTEWIESAVVEKARKDKRK